MQHQTTLIVPAENHWLEYLSRPNNSTCSGNDCEYCLKGMYKHRTGYLKSWINVYLKNKENIHSEKATMPRLRWYAAPYANTFNVGEYHRKRCDKNKSITICDCDIASILRIMFNPNDTDNLRSLDQIIPLFLKMKK